MSNSGYSIITGSNFVWIKAMCTERINLPTFLGIEKFYKKKIKRFALLKIYLLNA